MQQFGILSTVRNFDAIDYKIPQLPDSDIYLFSNFNVFNEIVIKIKETYCSDSPRVSQCVKVLKLYIFSPESHCFKQK